MKTTISLLAALVAALVMTALASASSYKLVMCNARQSAKTELVCAQRNIWHAEGTLQWIKRERIRTLAMVPASPARLLKLVGMQKDMTWLYKESARDKIEATARLPLTSTSDWLTAVQIVQRVWPGSAGWLISCSSSEGSHGVWVWNGGAPASSRAHGSGAGGWMQYMSGTFYGDYDDAVAYARAHGLTLPPPGSRNWYSAIGQAYAAGWAYGHNRPVGKWTGGNC